MRKFGPKKGIDSSIGRTCPACDVLFKEGDYTTLVALGPGDDKEQREKCLAGRPYNAVAQEIHWECSGYEEQMGME